MRRLVAMRCRGGETKFPGVSHMTWAASNQGEHLGRALIIGVGGQDGSLLAEYLLDLGYEICGVLRRTIDDYPNLLGLGDRIELVQADILDQRSLARAIERHRPQEVYNL